MKHTMNKSFQILSAICLVMLAAAGWFAALKGTVRAPVPMPTRMLVSGLPVTFAPLVRRVEPAVVNIAVTREVDPKSGRRIHVPPGVNGTPLEKRLRERMRAHGKEILGAGSGFIVDPSGFIVTSRHVIGDASDISVSLADGRELPARVIGSDDLTDIALIKVESPAPLPCIRWGDSRKVLVGDWVLAAGNPYGLGLSVTAGIISARGRDIGVGPLDDFLQLDAPMNPGNSGGPSFNMAGEVIALNTAFVSPTGGSVGLGFSMPAALVRPVAEALQRDGHIDRGWLGLTLEDVGGQEGARITSVDKDGPAQKVGLQKGDFVISFSESHVANARGLMRAVAAVKAGAEVPLIARRNQKTLNFQVMVGHRPVDEVQEADDDEASDDD